MITDTTDTAAAAGAATMFIVVSAIAGILGYALFSWILGKIFAKAGVESWKAWVPIYSSWVFLELGGQKGWTILLVFFPVINIVPAIYMVIAAYHIGVAFGKSGAWAALYFFLSPIWLILLAFDSSTYNSGFSGGGLPYSSASTPSYAGQYGGYVQPQQQNGGYARPTQAKPYVSPYGEQKPTEPKEPQFSSYYKEEEPEEEDDPFGIIPPKPKKVAPPVAPEEEAQGEYANPYMPISETPEPVVPVVPGEPQTGGYKRPDLSKRDDQE